MDGLLSLAIEAGPEMTTVRVAGEIDLASVPELRECLGTLAGDVVVDVSDVSFIDSQGLGFLVGEHLRRTERGERLVVCGVSANALHVMSITGVDQVLDVNGADILEAEEPAA
jgi:anti-sigma B factor antagonist